MADDILSPTDTEPDVARTSSLSTSSYDSINDSNLSQDKMELVIRKLRSENKQLQIRVLGVTELARLLQDRREKVKVLEDKNKRLEVAVVRLENRCANLEQKLRADGGTGPVSGPRSMQPPSIPGPSRQILEALMKENSELKKTLNGMQKKGPSGYLEAVKTNQLEEVIEQQKQELDFLKSQVNMLTTTPLPPSHVRPANDGERKVDSGSEPNGNSGEPGELRRQLIKMQHSLKVKDRFCSLLSDQVAALQDKINQLKLNDNPDTGTEEPPPAGSEENEGEKKLSELEGRYRAIIDDLKSTLQQERQEHTQNVEKLQNAKQELEKQSREYASLDKRCEDLQFLNHTLLEDKKLLQEKLDQMRAAGSGAAGGGSGGLEREVQELQDSLHRKVMEHSEELRNKDKEMQRLRMMLEDTEYKYVIAHSKLSEIEKEHEQHVSDLKDKVDEMESDVSSKQTEIEELRQVNRQLKMDFSSLLNKPTQPQPAAALFPRDISPTIPPLLLPHNMQNMVAVKDGGYIDQTVKRATPQPGERCETNRPETVYRMALVSRNMGDDEQQQQQQQQPHSGNQHPSTLTLRSQNQPPPPRHLSPSPSATSTTSAHVQPSHGAVTGRRSPLSPGFGHAGMGSSSGIPQSGTPRSIHQPHYSTPPPASTPYLSTPMGYAQPQPRHPHPLPPSGPTHMPGQQYYSGQGGRVNVPPQSGSPLPPGAVRPHRVPSDGDPHGLPPPHGYHGDPHHQHHTQRRN